MSKPAQAGFFMRDRVVPNMRASIPVVWGLRVPHQEPWFLRRQATPATVLGASSGLCSPARSIRSADPAEYERRKPVGRHAAGVCSQMISKVVGSWHVPRRHEHAEDVSTSPVRGRSAHDRSTSGTSIRYAPRGARPTIPMWSSAACSHCSNVLFGGSACMPRPLEAGAEAGRGVKKPAIMRRAFHRRSMSP